MHRGNNFSRVIDTQDMWVMRPDTRAPTLGFQPLGNVNSQESCQAFLGIGQ